MELDSITYKAMYIHHSPSRSSTSQNQGSTGNTLKEITVLLVKNIIPLLEFCLKNTYFSFQSLFYEWVEDAAMRSPVSPTVAYLYMEYFEQKALCTAPPKYGLGMWMTLRLSKGMKINTTSFNTSTVLTWPSSLQWKTTSRMRSSPSWIPLSNQRLMVNYHCI